MTIPIGPCPRPECGGDTHTDGWGNPTQCPRANQQDTSTRCPRCDCPDGHTQCDHCKTCPYARPVGRNTNKEKSE